MVYKKTPIFPWAYLDLMGFLFLEICAGQKNTSFVHKMFCSFAHFDDTFSKIQIFQAENDKPKHEYGF